MQTHEGVRNTGKYKFERKALARDYFNKLEGGSRNIMIANAKIAGELAGLNWKAVQLLELKDFMELMNEFNAFNDLADDHFLGRK